MPVYDIDCWNDRTDTVLFRGADINLPIVFVDVSFSVDILRIISDVTLNRVDLILERKLNRKIIRLFPFHYLSSISVSLLSVLLDISKITLGNENFVSLSLT
nr:MAG TPA: hypothetical protein [Caudoviricetes sp.]